MNLRLRFISLRFWIESIPDFYPCYSDEFVSSRSERVFNSYYYRDLPHESYPAILVFIYVSILPTIWFTKTREILPNYRGIKDLYDLSDGSLMYLVSINRLPSPGSSMSSIDLFYLVLTHEQ